MIVARDIAYYTGDCRHPMIYRIISYAVFRNIMPDCPGMQEMVEDSRVRHHNKTGFRPVK